MELKLGLQMYTLREEAKRDFVGTMEKVAEMGYKGVEFAGFGSMDSTQMRYHLNRLGLISIGNHTKLDDLRNKLNEVIQYNREIGSKYIICPHASFGSKQDYTDMAGFFNEIGRICHEEGFIFCYHNHAHEFEIFDGEYGLDILFKKSDHKLVQAEIDTCFVKVAGFDPADYIRKYSGRCPLIHLKDLEKGAARGTIEIGNGILDIKGIIETACKAYADWFIVEQEYFKGNCFYSAKESIENIKKLDFAGVL